MHDAALMRIVHRTGKGRDKPGGFIGRDRPFRDLFVEARAIYKLEREIQQPLVFCDIIDLHDIRMLKACDSFRLRLKAGPLSGTRLHAGADHLECDDTFECTLPGPVNDPHAAGAQPTPVAGTALVVGGRRSPPHPPPDCRR